MLTPWPSHLPRRASVNNFGYGGANAHAILEGYTRHAKNESTKNGWRSDLSHPMVFLLSSKDASVSYCMMSNLADYARRCQDGDSNVDLPSLAYTLAERRSLFPWRTAVTASSASELVLALDDPKSKPTFSRGTIRVGFVFNGQGAQWATMGKELFAYPVFSDAMHEAERILKSHGASWSLIGQSAATLSV